MSRFARDISDHELADYQRTVRLLLRHPLITATWPDPKALLRVRRFGATLRADLSDAFGYRLELHGSTARLVRTKDAIDATQPARSRTDRPFDRQRYACLMLCLAVLGRAGQQITLSELAESVASDAARIPGLGLDPDRTLDRRAFVDAVGWLEDRGAVVVADGSAASWASDPNAGEALYDIARDVLFALYRPTRMIQAVPSVAALLDHTLAGSANEERRVAAQAARRAVVEQPVVYYRDLPAAVANHVRGVALTEDLQRLTGLSVERRAEGALLVDTANLSVERFPGTGSVAQVAVLLAVEMSDRIIDPDGRRVRRMDGPGRAEGLAELVREVDAGLPSGVVNLAGDPAAGEPAGGRDDTGTSDRDIDDPSDRDGADSLDGAAGGGYDVDRRLPFIPDSFLRTAVAGVLARYASSFGAGWHADPERLGAEAVGLLVRFGCVTRVPGGVLVWPLTGRYRNTTATSRPRGGPALFSSRPKDRR